MLTVISFKIKSVRFLDLQRKTAAFVFLNVAIVHVLSSNKFKENAAAKCNATLINYVEG